MTAAGTSSMLLVEKNGVFKDDVGVDGYCTYSKEREQNQDEPTINRTKSVEGLGIMATT